MPSVLGKVSYDGSRTGIYNPANPGIANVPIVLQNTTTNERLVVLTDTNGDFEFINVPIGNYRLVESYGATGGVASPGNFASATVGSMPVGIDPPISFVTTAPVGATNLDSLSPNTLLINVASTNITNQNFLDGPVKYSSVIDPCVNTVGSNLITAGDNGLFGTYVAGTQASYAPALNPYPGITDGTLTYVTAINAGGQFTLRNIYLDTIVIDWWKVTNKTSGDETSGMLIADPAGTGTEVAFTQTVNVEANTEYMFTTWVTNLMKVTGYLDPDLWVKVLDSVGGVILNVQLSAPIPPNTNYPEWIQLGTTFNSGSNTQITVKLMSTTTSTEGNDFAIDGVELTKVDIPQFIPVKSVSKLTVVPNEIFTYSISLENTCSHPLTNVYFLDNIPTGTTFEVGSVTINGEGDPTLSPGAGFPLDDISGGTTTTVTYQVKVISDFSSLPEYDGIIKNTAQISYKYQPITGGYEISYNTTSNEVSTTILGCKFLARQYLNLINNDLYELDCDALLSGVNELVVKFNHLLKLTKDYLIYILLNNNDIDTAFKSQIERLIAVLNTYISMTNSLVFENNCNIEIFAYLLTLIVETSLIIMQLLQFLCGILSFEGMCGCIGDLSVEALIGKFINGVTILFCIAEDWRSIMLWIYQSKEQVGPSYAAAFVPRQSILPPPPRPMRYACTPCPPQPPCPPPNQQPRYGC